MIEKPPIEWIDKLFACMKEFYGARWENHINHYPEDVLKTMWQSALIGLTYDEIRKTLILCKKMAQNAGDKPPHQIDFYNIAKGKKIPCIRVNYGEQLKPKNPEVAKRYIDDIKNQLHPKVA